LESCAQAKDLDAEDARRLLKALRYADDRYDPVYPDFHIIQEAAELVRGDWPGLADELETFREKLIGALDDVNEGGK
jgi:hypothetical protein